MADWKKLPEGTVLLRYCHLHGYIETTSECCPINFGVEGRCDMDLDPAEPFVTLEAYDRATGGGS